MKPKPALVAGILSLAAFTVALGCGLFSGCGYCGQGLAILWGIAIALFLIIGAMGRGSRINRVYLGLCCSDDHEYFSEEGEELVAWHGDVPVLQQVRVKRCGKCGHQEVEDYPAFGR